MRKATPWSHAGPGRLNHGGPPGEYEECGLKRVLGIGRVTEDSPAHTEHHAAVTAHELRERFLIPAADVPIQQIAVGNPFEAIPRELRNQADDGILRHWYSTGRTP